jgi:hypothetical protein
MSVSSDWDPSMLPSSMPTTRICLLIGDTDIALDLKSGDVNFSTEHDDSLLATTSSLVAPTSDPQTTRPQYPQLTSQLHESMYPQLAASDSNARQREASSHAAGASVPASHTQPASGTSAEPDSTTADTLATLNTFSRLPPERMRTLFPVLTDIMASRQPSEALRG